MRPGLVVVFAVAALACTTASPRPVHRPSPEPDRSVAHDIPDVDDRCRRFAADCFADWRPGDDDGCPDPPPPTIVFAAGSVALPADAAGVVVDVARDAGSLAPGVRLRLEADGPPGEPDELLLDRAGRVRDALIAGGAPAAILEPAFGGPEDLEGHDPDPGSVVRIVAVGCGGGDRGGGGGENSQ